MSSTLYRRLLTLCGLAVLFGCTYIGEGAHDARLAQPDGDGDGYPDWRLWCAESTPLLDYEPADQVSFFELCSQTPQWALCISGDGPCPDCDDSAADVHPSAEEVCGDAIDSNCDGVWGACELSGPEKAWITVEPSFDEGRMGEFLATHNYVFGKSEADSKPYTIATIGAPLSTTGETPRLESGALYLMPIDQAASVATDAVIDFTQELPEPFHVYEGPIPHKKIGASVDVVADAFLNGTSELLLGPSFSEDAADDGLAGIVDLGTPPDNGVWLNDGTSLSGIVSLFGDVGQTRLGASVASTQGFFAPWLNPDELEAQNVFLGAPAWNITTYGEVEDFRERKVGAVLVYTATTFDTSCPRAESLAVPFGSEWAYHYKASSLTDQWVMQNYNDSDWSTGDAELGFGDGDETTTLTAPRPSLPTAYFRHQFKLDGLVDKATLNLVYDDGAVIWINGEEAFRVNVDNVEHAAFASAHSEDNATVQLDIDPRYFNSSANVISVMIKQGASEDAEEAEDLSFDLSVSLLMADSSKDPEPMQPTFCTDYVDYMARLPLALFVGEPTGGVAAGTLINAEGDFNSDGIQDILVSDPRYGGGKGRVYTLRGQTILSSYGTLGQFPSVTGTEEGDYLGSHLGTGDINGDGYSDALIGAPQTETTQRGYVVTRWGAATNEGQGSNPINLRFLGENDGDLLGTVQASADFDGDGIHDIALGAPGENDEKGAVYLIYGEPNLDGVYLVSERSRHKLEGGGAGDEFGYSLALSADPLASSETSPGILLVGAPGADNDSGRVYLFHGESLEL